jgi:2-oxoisovalerate dehydrogenase E1 component
VFNRAEVVDKNLVRFATEWNGRATGTGDPAKPVRPGFALTGAELIELLETQLTSRHLDLIARELRAENKSYYTIGSSGHEGNAVVGRATRHTDPAYLHYRSGGFMLERARKVAGQDMIRDTILSQVASSEDPIAGGRHKVWGSKALHVPPQTSTIASHLPKAVGAAIALERGRRMGAELPVPDDSIVVCTFGDASSNHSTAQGAFNAASYSGFQRLPVPVLFVCEDNGIGISVRTADGWVAANYRNRPGLKYFSGDGLDVVEAYEVATEAVAYCRTNRAPVFLHLSLVRLLGHAGTDFEPEYRSMELIEEAEANDPVLATARLVLESGLMSGADLAAMYEGIRKRVRAEADKATTTRKLESAEQIIAPLGPFHADRVAADAMTSADEERRIAVFGGADRLPENGDPKHLAVQINRALHDAMCQHDDVVLFGEDVAQKGGVYHVTTGLAKTFGLGRVFNTLLDEQSILGLAQGFGAMDMLPIPEIQYLAYYHNAEDQIRGEACSLQFFSNDQFRNPMVVRIASFGYQKGFGGHFHNDNSIAALRDIPGLIVMAPSRGDDAVRMLRTAISLARVDGRVVAFLEPIALYMTKDLYEPGDGKWLTRYPAPGEVAGVGEPHVYHADATDVVILTYANGTHMSLRAAKRLADDCGIQVRVVDLCWISPLNTAAIAEHASSCARVLVVDEGRKTGGVGEAVVTAVAEGCDPVPPIDRVVGMDTYIPLGPAAELVMPCEEQIVAAVRELCSV